MPAQKTILQEVENRRRHPRMAVHWSGQLVGADGPLDCLILDISKAGAQVQCADPVDEVSSVTLVLGHGGEHEGSVVWQQGSFMGLRFQAA